jgi:DNA-binding NarL/FixJ family response regulator
VYPLKVLVVDDNDDFRANLLKYLEKQPGVEVIQEAKGGLEAITFAHYYLPHLVLLDISMPGFSGIEVAKYIKRYHPETKVVFVSIHEEETCRALTQVLPVDGFVSKSYLNRDLPHILKKFRIRLLEGTNTHPY